MSVVVDTGVWFGHWCGYGVLMSICIFVFFFFFLGGAVCCCVAFGLVRLVCMKEICIYIVGVFGYFTTLTKAIGIYGRSIYGIIV